MSLNLKESFERWCRLCAEEQEVTIMIFSAEAEAMLLNEKLNKYLLIEIDEDDKLPKNICIKCCTTLQTVCEFIDKVKKAQEKLLYHSSVINEFEIQEWSVPITEIKLENENLDYHEIDSQDMPMEICVDPMMVLQNSDDLLSPTGNDLENNVDNVMHLNGVDGEDVTIKLIKSVGDRTESTATTDFFCVICERSFVTELSLRNHSIEHANDKTKKYNCSSCKEGFDYKCDLNSHFKTHQSNGGCNICGKKYRSERLLSAHMAAHISKGNNCYTCKVCYRSYRTKCDLKNHSIAHSKERPYQCHLCNRCFKRKQELKYHFNHHTGAKPYHCPYCEKSFASAGNCYTHKHRMHPERRMEGGKVYKLPPSLQNVPPSDAYAQVPRYTITKINGEIKYQCQLCNHCFKKRDNFMYHMYQHTGEKPFQCCYCDVKFLSRRTLVIHYEKQHPEKKRPRMIISRHSLVQNSVK